MFLAQCSLGPLAVILVLSLAGCGGTVKNDPNSSAGSTGGAPGGAGAAPALGGNGGTTSGSGGMSPAGGGAGGQSVGVGGSSAGAPTGEDPNTSCNQPTDCELRGSGCCGGCEPITASSLIAVNHSAPTCGDVFCSPCPPVAPNQSTRRYYIPGCVAHRCTVVDIRETALTACETNSDCGLRNTAACCQLCGVSGDPIAYNKKLDQVTAFCGGVPEPCLACVGGVAEGFVTECRVGRCVVDQLVK